MGTWKLRVWVLERFVPSSEYVAQGFRIVCILRLRVSGFHDCMYCSGFQDCMLRVSGLYVSGLHVSSDGLYVSSDTCCPRRWQRRHQRRLHVLWPHMLACFRVSLAVEIVDECACLSDYVRAMRNYVCSCVRVCVYVVCCMLPSVSFML